MTHSPRRAAAQPGQTIVIFALSSLLLFGGMGLILDSGYDFVQRRTMQNAADAAALAGVGVLSGNAAATTVHSVVTAVAVQNGVPSGAGVVCQYSTDTNPAAATCQAGTAPPTNVGTITGVRVTVAERHATFVMKAVGSPASGTGATAAARIQRLGGYPGSAVPFVPCGLDTKCSISRIVVGMAGG